MNSVGTFCAYYTATGYPYLLFKIHSWSKNPKFIRKKFLYMQRKNVDHLLTEKTKTKNQSVAEVVF